jgi:hypothetical protein
MDQAAFNELAIFGEVFDVYHIENDMAVSISPYYESRLRTSSLVPGSATPATIGDWAGNRRAGRGR